MESTHTNSYAPPIDQLLTYGEGQIVSPDDWPHYLELGLGPEQILDLIRLATDEELIWDDSDRLEVWAPLHAWRALGQLRAEAAIEPLLSLFEPLVENDWAMEELPAVLGMIGPAALPALTAYIADSSYDEDARISAISSVEKIGTRWPEARPVCVAFLMKQLELFTENEPEVNGFLILALVELQATEAAPLMEQAFAAERVDPIVIGEWEDVQVELGLKATEEVEQSRSKRFPQTPLPSTAREMPPPAGSLQGTSPTRGCAEESQTQIGQTIPEEKSETVEGQENGARAVHWDHVCCHEVTLSGGPACAVGAAVAVLSMPFEREEDGFSCGARPVEKSLDKETRHAEICGEPDGARTTGVTAPDCGREILSPQADACAHLAQSR